MSLTFEELELRNFGRGARDLISLAFRLGYRVTQHNKVVTLHSPVQPKTIVIPPIRQMNDAKGKSLYDQVIRYGDERKVRAETRRIEKMIDEADKPQNDIRGFSATVRKEAPEPRPVPNSPLGVVHVSETPVKRHIVKEFPRKVKANSISGVSTYDSDAVLERHWSDGSVDFACAWKGCAFTNDEARPVSRHYAASKSHRKVPVPHWEVDPSLVPQINPDTLERRIGRLADELKDALAALRDSKGGLPQYIPDLATQLAGKIIGKRDERREERMEEEHHELTAEQIVERIRRMVDGGAYVTAQREREELTQEVVKLRDDLAQANAAIQKAKEDKKALLDLLAEED